MNSRKKLMGELHDSVNYNNLNFKYAGQTKDVSFYTIWILKSFLMQ